jgi:hypothetical protein
MHLGNSYSDCGLSPLHLAAGEGQLALVETLIREGADLNATDKQGYKPAGALRIVHIETWH